MTDSGLGRCQQLCNDISRLLRENNSLPTGYSQDLRCNKSSFWLRLFILSGDISPLFSSSILGTYQPGEFIFHCPIFLPFHTVHGVLKARIQSGLPFLSPVDHILSKLSTMTCPSWVALHGMAHSFLELDKAVVHVIRLVSFL